jgi:hypothetical protein
MFNTVLLVTFLLTQILFPAAVAIAAAIFISRWVRGGLRRKLSAPAVESDVQNEELDPISERNAQYLIFALVFNVSYLTIDPTLVNQILFQSPLFYAASLAFFLVGLFVALMFELRFVPQHFTLLGIAFAAAGSIVVLATVRFNFAGATSTGSSTGSSSGSSTGSSTGLVPGSHVGMMLVPVVLVTCAWSVAVIALLAEGRNWKWTLPFRFPSEGAYRTLLLAVVLGWVGIMLALIPMLIRLA